MKQSTLQVFAKLIEPIYNFSIIIHTYKQIKHLHYSTTTLTTSRPIPSPLPQHLTNNSNNNLALVLVIIIRLARLLITTDFSLREVLRTARRRPFLNPSRPNPSPSKRRVLLLLQVRN